MVRITRSRWKNQLWQWTIPIYRCFFRLGMLETHVWPEFFSQTGSSRAIMRLARDMTLLADQQGTDSGAAVVDLPGHARLADSRGDHIEAGWNLEVHYCSRNFQVLRDLHRILYICSFLLFQAFFGIEHSSLTKGLESTAASCFCWTAIALGEAGQKSSSLRSAHRVLLVYGCFFQRYRWGLSSPWNHVMFFSLRTWPTAMG